MQASYAKNRTTLFCSFIIHFVLLISSQPHCNKRILSAVALFRSCLYCFVFHRLLPGLKCTTASLLALITNIWRHRALWPETVSCLFLKHGLGKVVLRKLCPWCAVTHPAAHRRTHCALSKKVIDTCSLFSTISIHRLTGPAWQRSRGAAVCLDSCYCIVHSGHPSCRPGTYQTSPTPTSAWSLYSSWNTSQRMTFQLVVLHLKMLTNTYISQVLMWDSKQGLTLT